MAMAAASTRADEANRPPPGQEARRTYSADEKAQLLEEWITARAAGEGDDLSIAARLGVSRAALYNWKAQLERGEDLEDGRRSNGPRKEEEKEPVAAQRKSKATGKGSRKGMPNTPLTTRLEAALALESGKSSAQVAKKYKVHPSTVTQWRVAYKRGDYSAVGRTPNAHGKPDQIVMFEPEEVMATKKPKQPVSLGRVSHVVDADEVSALRAALAVAQQENARLQKKIRALVGLVSDD